MVSGPEVAANLETAARLIEQAATAGARIVALPEYFPLIGASDAERLAAREADGAGPIQDFLAATAKRHGLWLIGGSMPLVAREPDKLRNSTLVFDPQGQRVARYDKIHLFAFDNGEEHYAEGETIEAGEDIATVSIAGLRVGLGICYDLRFPELFRRMGTLDLIVLPAAFTATTGRAHWELLLRARAIENQCYVLAAAQGGLHPGGRRTHGHSMIVDPWGEILACHATGEAVVMAEFSATRLTELRRRLPALQHRIF
ncbi:MAG: acyltransferase [Betaproteobacteria bacterium HGW-Betaproteobacteria-11]|nr:MAG: acyltransferase [Betaproteobacteria bacterium HGW-Betaproteobacteria-11]